MRRYHLDEIACGALGPLALTIGNFDGVHRGHQFILQCLAENAKKFNLPMAVLTFEPHPIKVLYPEKGLQMIVPHPVRAHLLERQGVDILITEEFTPALSKTPAEEWVRRILLEQLKVEALIIGYDFSFGRGRDGNSDHLMKLGQRLGFEVQQVNAVIEEDWPISSSRIRRLIAAGEVDSAHRLLGRPFHMAGRIDHGDHRGHTLGFPTANLKTEWEIIPHGGVYAGVAVVEGQTYGAAINVGKNPTFELTDLRIEAFLLDFTGDLYGKEMELHFIHRLRDEKKFQAIDQLIAAMHVDVAKTRELFQQKAAAAWLE